MTLKRELFEFHVMSVQRLVSLIIAMFCVNALPDYIALWETRFVLGVMRRWKHTVLWAVLLCVDVLITGITILAFGAWLTLSLYANHSIFSSGFLDYLFLVRFPGLAASPFTYPLSYGFFYPALFTCGWLWLFAGSGILLRISHGTGWFNRHFDIEKKPLQSIGLVAGALVAVVYWAAVIVSRVVG